ncbi:MAG: hypothetical protein IT393_07120 [Nitrospirae bacterium]|nr:hypothetical protein [Nitrospirota bacterium]
MTSRKTELFSNPSSLREALYDMVHRSKIPAKAQVEELGISYSYLCNASNPNLEGEGFDYQLRLLIPHTRITQNFTALNFIEQSLGRIAIQIPNATPSTGDLVKEFSRTTSEFSDIAREIGNALQDDKITEAEYRRLEKESWELIRQTILLLEKVKEAVRPNGGAYHE